MFDDVTFSMTFFVLKNKKNWTCWERKKNQEPKTVSKVP